MIYQLSVSRMRWAALIRRWSKLPPLASARLQSIRPSWKSLTRHDASKHAAPRKMENRKVLGVRVIVPNRMANVSLRRRRASAACW